MANRKLPTVQLTEPDDVKQLSRMMETELNDIIVRVNEDALSGDLNANDFRIKNLSTPAESHDAVNLEYLEERIGNTEKKFTALQRPRKPGAVPGAFREFRAEHLQRHPEKLCKDAEPYIRLLTKLPTQANKGSGLVDELVIKRNTDYVELQSEWTALTSAVDSTQTTMVVDDPTFIKQNTLYKIGSEYVRTSDGGSNPVTIERAQEGSVASTATASEAVYWAAVIPREGFSADENGVLTSTVEIDNSERQDDRVFEGWSVNEDGIAGSTSTYTLSLDAGHDIADLVIDPRFGEVILSWSELGGDTYRYRIYKRINGAPAATDQYFYDEIPADGTGVMVWTDVVPRPGDANAAIGTWGDTVSYLVQSINVICETGTADTVGPSQGDSSSANPASDVSGLSASESPVCGVDGSGQSEVTVSWSSQPSDVDKVRIYLLKNGDTNPTLVGSFDASPGKFTVPTIDPSENQTVTLYFVSVNDSGVENEVLASPSTTVDLDGQTSAPNPPN